MDVKGVQCCFDGGGGASLDLCVTGGCVGGRKTPGFMSVSTTYAGGREGVWERKREK